MDNHVNFSVEKSRQKSTDFNDNERLIFARKTSRNDSWLIVQWRGLISMQEEKEELREDGGKKKGEGSITGSTESPAYTAVAWDSRIIPWQTINYWHYVLEYLLALPTTDLQICGRTRYTLSSNAFARSLARTHARMHAFAIAAGRRIVRFPHFPLIPSSREH